jgi:hypothetical protein
MPLLDSSALTSVPDLDGSESETESIKSSPANSGKDVVIVRFKCDPSADVHPVPAEGELELDCSVKPVHGLHVFFPGIAKPLPIKTYAEE